MAAVPNVQVPPRDLSRSLEEVLGPKLVAVIAGVSSTEIVHAWSRGEREPQPEIVERLRNTAEVANTLLAVESPQTVQSWFMGTNSALDGHAPALMLASDPAMVLLAARSFAAHG